MERDRDFIEKNLKFTVIYDYILGLFTDPNEVFISYYEISPKNQISKKDITREEFYNLTLQALNVLLKHDLGYEDKQLHFFSGNKIEVIFIILYYLIFIKRIEI
jgi:hypothetical protein